EIERCAGVVRTLTDSRGRTDGVDAGNDLDRSRAEVRRNTIQLPVAEHIVGGLAPPLERRQLVNKVADEGMASIEIGVAPVGVEIERVARRVGKRRQRYV